MRDPDVIDAKFKVVRPPRGQRRPWFDWRNFLIVGGLSLLAVMGQAMRQATGL